MTVATRDSWASRFESFGHWRSIKRWSLFSSIRLASGDFLFVRLNDAAASSFA